VGNIIHLLLQYLNPFRVLLFLINPIFSTFSGNLKLDAMDEKLTRKLKPAGESLDISFLDHLILTSEAYYSFADEGNM
jgi:hypothetical protein